MSLFVLKTIVAGEGGIGKTTIVKKFMNEVLKKDYKMTIGVDIFSKTLLLNDNSVTLSVHDVAGQKRFSMVKDLFMRGTQLAVFVFDLTRKETLYKIREDWIPPLLERSPEVTSILIGNKSDLEDLRVFDEKEIKKFLKGLQKDFPQCNFIQYIETSALYNTNVDYAFKTLAKAYLKKKKK